MNARLILKCPYFRGGCGKAAGNYTKYIATRDGVELCDESWKNEPATDEQQRLIRDLLSRFPASKFCHEYRDYTENQSKYFASQLITRAIEDNYNAIGKIENYVQYIARRPRVERIGTHGLFSLSGKAVDLNSVIDEVANHQGIVFTIIASLRREDAGRLGYDNANAWQLLLQSKAQEIADRMGINVEEMRCYAAFHNEGHHPHIHMVVYSKGKDPYLNREGIANLQHSFIEEIFKQDLMHIYEDKTEARNRLRRGGRSRIREMVAHMSTDGNERIDALFAELAHRLSNYKGKKVYGYLPKGAKRLVSAIVDELEKDESISELYEDWYRQQEKLIGIYRKAMPPRVPLSENPTFKDIKNAIIEEVGHFNARERERLSAKKEEANKHFQTRLSVFRLFRAVMHSMHRKAQPQPHTHTMRADKKIRDADREKRASQGIKD